MGRILILFASAYGQTRAVAERLAIRMRDRGLHVELVDIADGRPPPAASFDVVVLGSRVQYGNHARALVEYIKSQRRDLTNRPTYFFSVSGRAAGEPHLADPGHYIGTLVDKTGWQPKRAIAIGGGLPYRRYSPLLRMFMKLISRSTGQPTDTSRDHEFTNWDQVAAFADTIVNDRHAARAATHPASELREHPPE